MQINKSINAVYDIKKLKNLTVFIYHYLYC